jgi:hypothetical protein
MEQMELFSTPTADYIANAEYPTSYRIDKHGWFVVTADVPGVGKISRAARSLWPAFQSCQTAVANALEARSSTMF